MKDTFNFKKNFSKVSADLTLFGKQATTFASQQPGATDEQFLEELKVMRETLNVIEANAFEKTNDRVLESVI